MPQYKVLLTQTARNDLAQIERYYCSDAFYAFYAKRTIKRILMKCQGLKIFPEMNPRYHIYPKYRMAKSGKYLILFSVNKAQRTVYINKIFYSKKKLA